MLRSFAVALVTLIIAVVGVYVAMCVLGSRAVWYFWCPPFVSPPAQVLPKQDTTTGMVHVRRIGRGSTVVLVSRGNAGNVDVWEHILVFLRPWCTVYVYDYRYTNFKRPWAWQALREDGLAALKHVQSRHPRNTIHFMGVSLGGMVAPWLWEQYGGPQSRLGLLAPLTHPKCVVQHHTRSVLPLTPAWDLPPAWAPSPDSASRCRTWTGKLDTVIPPACNEHLSARESNHNHVSIMSNPKIQSEILAWFTHSKVDYVTPNENTTADLPAS